MVARVERSRNPLRAPCTLADLPKKTTVFLVARPSSLTGRQYAEVSTPLWEAAHRTLNGYGSAGDNLAFRLLRARAGW